MKRIKKTVKLTLSTTSVRALSESVHGGIKPGPVTVQASICGTCYRSQCVHYGC
jgi:hypothetical protein